MPDYADALVTYGHALRHLGRSAEALIQFERARVLRPDRQDVSIAVATALTEVGRDAEALDIFPRVIQDPDTALLYANCLLRSGRSAEALAAYDHVLTLAPDQAPALDQRAVALVDLDRLSEALDSVDRALAVTPDLESALANRGKILMALGRHVEGADWLESALVISPDRVALNFNLSTARLLLGDFDRGLPRFEWRWRLPGMKPFVPDGGEKLWLGQGDIAGKTIVLYADQGLGDAIQFCRYAALVAARGATVVLFVQPALRRLLAGLKGVDRLLTAGDDVPAFDLYCPLLSLPLAFRTRPDSIPSESRYIEPDSEAVGAWTRRLGPKTRRRVGVFWSSTTTDRLLRKRAVPLRQFADIFQYDADIFALQKDIGEHDRAILDIYPAVTNLAAELTDFAETAAAVEAMDLVITVDSSVAHLAGALGKPVWILLPHDPDWRWLLGRDDSPWYPTARLFRQPAPGDWDTVLTRVIEELSQAAED